MEVRPTVGWRERAARGIYRRHALSCPASENRVPGRRCACPFQIQVPAAPPARSRTVTVQGTLAEARAERHRLLGAGRPEPAPDRDPDLGTLDEVAGRYLKVRSATLAPNTIATTERHYLARVSPRLGHRSLEQIDRRRVEGWLSDLVAAGASRSMVIGSVAALRTILSAAVEWGLIERNPAMGLRLPAPETHNAAAVERVLTPAQLARLIGEGCPTVRSRSMISLAAETGLRRGEVIGLRWGDVDLGTGWLRVRRSVSQTPDGKGGSVKVERTTKGRKARRVKLSASLAATLGEWFAESVVSGGADAVGRVWPGRGGEPLDAGSPGQLLARALERAGLVEPGEAPPVTFHGLRHTCASILLGAGVPLIVVSRHLGHANPNITATVYAHLLSDAQLADAGEVVRRATEGMQDGMQKAVDEL